MHARRKLPYQFHYIPDGNFINAFALPGGHVFIGAGLIARMKSEDELADVLGHEIEHIDHYHCAERLQTEAVLRHIPLGGLAAMPVAVFQAGYSKDQELEADREGVRLAAQAGYSAQGAIQAFRMFERLDPERRPAPGTPVEELSRVAAEVLTGYFQTHPATAERIEQIQRLIASNPALAAAPERALAVRYIFLGRRSQAAIQAGKFIRALALARSSLRLAPDFGPALAAECEAQFALGQPAARSSFQALLQRGRLAAGAVESWIDAGAPELFHRHQYARLAAEEEARLAANPARPESLKLEAWAQAALGNASGAAAAVKRLQQTGAGEAAKAELSSAAQAADAYRARDFTGAAASAAVALLIAPADAGALSTAGRAKFALADFAQAAGLFEKLLNLHLQAAGPRELQDLADALANVNPATAAAEFGRALPPAKAKLANGSGLPQSAIAVERSGLQMLAAGRQQPPALAAGGAWPAAALTRLGWWYFRAGRYRQAETILRASLNYDSGNAELQNMLEWVALAQGKAKPEDFQKIPATVGDVMNTPSAGLTLAEWERRQTRAAIEDWAAVRRESPQWLNAAWRQALYPAAIAAAAGEMEAAYQREQAKKRMEKRSG